MENLPEGFTLDSSSLPSGFTLDPPEPEIKPDKYPTLAAAADVPLSFGRGAVTGVKMIADAFGADNPVSQTLFSVDTYLEDLMSAQSKRDAQEVSRIMNEAKDKGVWDQVKAGLSAFSVAPVDLLTNAFGTAAPTVVAGLLAAAAAPEIAVGTAVGIGVGAVSGAGTIKDRIYTDVKRALTDQGVAPEKADAAAQEAQAYGGKNLDQIMLGALFGAGASVTGAEAALVKGLSSKILGNAAKEAATAVEEKAAKGIGGRLVEGAIKEAVPEAAQEAQEQVASNIAQQREGVDVPTFQGAGTSAALAGGVGAIMGGGLNVATTSGPRTVDKEAENAVLLKALETNRRAMDDDKFLEFANTLRDRVPVLGEILDSNVPRATKLSLIQSRIAEANIGGTQEQIDVGGPRGLPAPEIQKSENLRQVLNNTIDIADRAGVPLGDLTVNQGPEGWRIVSPDSKIMSDPMPLGSEREANVVLEGIRRTHDERQTERYRAESDEYRRDLDKQMTAATVAAARESMTPFEPISLDEIFEYDPALFNKIYDSRLKDKSVATKEDAQAPVTIDEMRKRGAKRDDINHFAIQQKPFTAGTGGLRPGIEDELYGVGVKPTEPKPMAKTEEELARQKYATVTPVDVTPEQVRDIEEEEAAPSPSQEAQDLRDAYTRLRRAGYTDEQIGGLTKEQFYNALVEGDGAEFSRSKEDRKSEKERKKIYALYDQIEAGRDRRENGVTAPVKPLRSALAPELTDEEIADARKIIEDRVAKYEAAGKQGAAIGKGVRDAIANSDFTPNQLLQAFQVADISARLLGKTDADPHALEFVQRIATPFGDTAGGARIAPSEKLQGIIKMALDKTYDPKSTTAHESFHVLQDLFAAYDKAGAKIINDAFKGATSFDGIDANLLRKLKSLRDPDTGNSVYTTLKENVEDKGLLEDYDQATREREMQAYVFGYMDNAITNGNQSMGGLGAAFVRFLNYYRQFKDRVGNYFKGLGYQTAEDVLGATSRGTRQAGLGVAGELVKKALPGESEEFSRGKEPMRQTIITAKTMLELRNKIYTHEGWTRTSGESYAKRMKSAYTITMDVKNNQWKAVKNEEKAIKAIKEKYAAGDSEFSRAKPSEVPLQDRVPGLKAVWPHLTPDERERLVVVSARSLVRRFEELPSSAEMAAVAFSGRAKRGWYYNSAKALINIFGLSDGRRFAALLAATSPQTSVQSNLINALNIWKNWVNAGRPTGQKEILSIMGRSVEGSRGEDSVLDAWKNNTIRALATKDAHLIDLDISGPKVNSFMKNLWGVTQEVTNDAWIANYAGVDQKIFARSAGPRDELGVVGVKSPGYMAMSAVTRKAADILSKKTGETWTPDEVQETVWSWAKALYEMRRGRGKDTTTKALLKQGELTAERVNAVPDFEVLFVQNVYRKILEDAGYGEQVGRQAEIVQERGRGTESGGKGINAFDAEKSGFAQSDFQRHLLEAADRLENLYQTRLNAGEPEGEIEFSRAAALTGDSVEEFKAWWKKSQAVDENGQPKTYYTGKATTRLDKDGKPFKTFGRAGSGALVDAMGVPMRGVEGPYYFSPEPPFASQFAMRRLSKNDFKEKRADQAAEGGRMIPAFLSVQNPFDYDNQDHVDLLFQDPMLKEAILRNNVYKAMIEMGWWKELEKRVVQLAIRRAGFDGFYLMEQLPEFDDNNKPTGNKIVSKNLAVYKANQIKSIFNQFLPGTAVSREFSRAIAATKQEKEAKANSTRYFQVWDKAREFFNPLALVNNLPQFLSFRNVTTGTITMSEQYARKMADKIAKGSVEERQAVYKFMTTKAGDSSLIKDPEIRKAAIEAKKAINDYAKLMVARKEMTQESFDNYYDRYLPRIYLLYEATNRGMKTPMGGTSVREYLDKRDEELSEEYRKVLGEIKDPSYLTYIALSRPARDIAMSDYLNNLFTFGGDPKNQWIAPQSIVEYDGKKYTPYDLQHMADDLDSAAEIAKNLSEDQAKAMRKEASKMRRVALAAQGDLKYKLDEIRARGYEQIPTRRQYGPLAGAVVQKGIYQDLVGTFIPVGKDNPSLIERLIGDEHSAVQKANALWKLGKTTLNPPTQVVNFVSNAISLNLFGGVPIHKFPYLFKKTMNEIMKNGSMYQEAQKFGLTGGTMSKVELDRAFIRMQRYQAKVGGEGNLVNMFATSRAIGSAFIEKAGDAYQFSESLFKMMMYIHSVETDKMKPSDAVNAANEIMFDYSLVNNNIRWLRNAPLGLPFITYYYKVLPKIIETIYKHPQRFIPYIALAYALPAMTMAAFDLDDDELEKLRLSAQDYVRDSGTLFFLPFRDSKGNIQFVDVGKYLPFSSLLSPFITAFKYGNYTKAAFELTRPITPSGPVITTIAALATGVDPFTNKPIMDPRDTNKAQALALFSYIFNQAMPPVIGMDFNNFEKSSGALPRVYNSLFVDGTGVDKRGMPKPELLESAARILGLNITPLKADVQRLQNINYMASQINKTRSLMAQTAADQSLMPDRKREKNRELVEKVKEQVLEMQKYANDTANIGQITKKIKEAP